MAGLDLQATKTPMISCLMVTRAQRDRHVLTAASLNAFAAQTYSNKELIVVISGYQADDKVWLEQTLAALPQPISARIVDIPGDPAVGYLRNCSISEAEGDILCQWDDDDICHPERLAQQADLLAAGGYDAVYLQDVLHYFPARQEIYWTNWRKTEIGAHPGTLMISRSAAVKYDGDGPGAQLGEDRLVALRLKEIAKVGVLESAPHLYMYVSHGANSWHAGHHDMLADQLAVSRSFLNRREKDLRDALGAYSLPLDGVAVCGGNGRAFTLNQDVQSSGGVE
jgi:hypothetical protein